MSSPSARPGSCSAGRRRAEARGARRARRRSACSRGCARPQRVLGGDVGGLTVLVQGAGGVGGNLVELLGKGVLSSSPTSTRHGRETRRPAWAAPSSPVERATETECDVYAPCALGGTLDESTIRGLRCRIVAGAANNQLATPEDADRLAARGIVYGTGLRHQRRGALHGAGLEPSAGTVRPSRRGSLRSARRSSRSTTGRSATARARPPRPSGSRRSGSQPRPFSNSREGI